jgi:hypothetical protein
MRARAASLVLAASVLAASVSGPGCAHQGEAPADTLSAFGAAIERKDYEAAYALTSSDFRKRVPLATFRAELEAGGPDAQALGRRLRETAGHAPLRVEVDVDLGEKLPLVYDGGHWRVDGQPFELWSQKTPRAALRSFIRALDRRRYDVALRLVPNRYRAGLTAEKLRDYWEGERKTENGQLLGRLRAAVSAGLPIVEVGDEAHMPYGEKYEVRFVREDGAWKIEDPD